MSAINNVQLIGRVAREPKRFNHDQGTNVIFTLAVERGRKDANGQDLVDWIDVRGFSSVQNPTTKFDYIHAGDLVAVRGKISSYVAKDKTTGQNVYKWVVDVRDVEYLAKNKHTKKTMQPEMSANTVATPAGATK